MPMMRLQRVTETKIQQKHSFAHLEAQQYNCQTFENGAMPTDSMFTGWMLNNVKWTRELNKTVKRCILMQL